VTFKPVARSPLHQRLSQGGVNFSQAGGWLVAEHFGNPQGEVQSTRSAAGLADLSSSAKWEAQGADLAQSLRTILEREPVEPGRVVLCEGGYICRLSTEQAFLILDETDGIVLRRLRERSNGCLHLVDRTSGFGHLVLCGPQARTVLCKVTSLNLGESAFPDLRCAWAPMAGIRVLVVRKNHRDLPAYEILVSREYAEYLWDAVTEAGREYLLRPLGLEAVRLLSS